MTPVDPEISGQFDAAFDEDSFEGYYTVYTFDPKHLNGHW